MSRLAPLRRRIALWLCPDLTPPAPDLPVDPIDLPLWDTEFSRPKWWGNAELRAYLTQTHRRLKLVDAQAEAVRDAPNPSQSQEQY